MRGTRTVRRPALIAVLAASALIPLIPTVARSADPPSGTISEASPNASWSGSAFLAPNLVLARCLTGGDPSCDVFTLTVQPPEAETYSAEITATPSRPSAVIDFYVWDENGNRLGKSSGSGAQTFTLENPAAGKYEVHVFGRIVEPGDTYTGQATLKVPSAPDDDTPVLHRFDPAAPKASAEAPLRIVLVGFNRGEVDESALISQIAPEQRPGVLIPHASSGGGGAADADGCGVFFGAETLINHGRCYFEEQKPFLVPVELRWKPQVIYASSSFAKGLFGAMNEASSTGELSGPTFRPYLEQYNQTRGIHRGLANQVPENAPVRFVDGEKTEDWLAQNSLAHLGFELGPKGGANLGPGREAGYTIFVLNTWDSPDAKLALHPEHEYHLFKVNRIDPDTHEFAGVDWARVWGGRYRELILDLGAAPNPYESETWGNRRRAVFGSDSYDPPLWEYRANAPRPVVPGHLADPEQFDQAVSPGATWDKASLEFNIARFASEAASFRFLHSYLYEPRPQLGRYFLSSNVWHDQKAEIPWPSDLTKLYNQDAVLSGLRTLVPYFMFEGDVRYEYLRDGSADFTADQAKLDEAKQQGGDPLIGSLGGVPYTAMNTVTAMDYLDARPERFERGGSCFTTVPNLEVVVEKHYAWALPVIVAGIATNRDGVPWGFLASVSDLTKSPVADREGDVLSPVHPDAFGGSFTYTSIHELSHYLGLAHPHDTIGAWRNPRTGETQYWDGFTWTFNTTAAPTTYSHDELTYSILDQETIARGHLAYYLKWTDEALAEAGQAFYDAGQTRLRQLPRRARTLRTMALDSMRKAQQLFAAYDFVRATFAAQKAWQAAAAYRDIALKLSPGASEIAKGTKASGASACPSASR